MDSTTKNHSDGRGERSKLPSVLVVEVDFDDTAEQDDPSSTDEKQRARQSPRERVGATMKNHNDGSSRRLETTTRIPRQK